ncbi:MAG: HRDC domain-containing protein, partial [Proteobacteria bacterium]|nr:HRDC domain-containing protein [Pseudomonadota bacterium]
VIFGDATLREMARLRPTSCEAFRRVRGVGDRKLADLGGRFTAEIAAYCREHVLETEPVDVVASGTFEFSAATSDIDGNVTFTKDVTLAASLPEIFLQHVLIGDWETEWSLIKMGFQLDGFGGLIGFDPADVTFGSTGIFDVNITMVPPMPGHPSFFEFVAEEPFTLMSIEDVLALIPAVAEFTALIAAIGPLTLTLGIEAVWAGEDTRHSAIAARLAYDIQHARQGAAAGSALHRFDQQ